MDCYSAMMSFCTVLQLFIIDPIHTYLYLFRDHLKKRCVHIYSVYSLISVSATEIQHQSGCSQEYTVHVCFELLLSSLWGSCHPPNGIGGSINQSSVWTPNCDGTDGCSISVWVCVHGWAWWACWHLASQPLPSVCVLKNVGLKLSMLG